MSPTPTLFIQGATYNYGKDDKKEYVCKKVINQGNQCIIVLKQFLNSPYPTERDEKTIDITQAAQFITPVNLTQAEIWLSSNKVIADSFEPEQDYYIIHYDNNDKDKVKDEDYKDKILKLTCTSNDSRPLFRVEGCVNERTNGLVACMKTTLDSVELDTIESLYKQNPKFNGIVPSFYKNKSSATQEAPTPTPVTAAPVEKPKNTSFMGFLSALTSKPSQQNVTVSTPQDPNAVPSNYLTTYQLTSKGEGTQLSETTIVQDITKLNEIYNQKIQSQVAAQAAEKNRLDEEAFNKLNAEATSSAAQNRTWGEYYGYGEKAKITGLDDAYDWWKGSPQSSETPLKTGSEVLEPGPEVLEPGPEGGKRRTRKNKKTRKARKTKKVRKTNKARKSRKTKKSRKTR